MCVREKMLAREASLAHARRQSLRRNGRYAKYAYMYRVGKKFKRCFKLQVNFRECGNAFFHRTTNAAGKIEPDNWPVVRLDQLSGSIFPAAFVVRWKYAFPHKWNEHQTCYPR